MVSSWWDGRVEAVFPREEDLLGSEAFVAGRGGATTPLFSEEVVALRQHRQRRPVVCRHFLSLEAELASLDGGRLRPRVPASARQSENVPVSYPRNAHAASEQTTEKPICRVLREAL